MDQVDLIERVAEEDRQLTLTVLQISSAVLKSNRSRAACARSALACSHCSCLLAELDPSMLKKWFTLGDSSGLFLKWKERVSAALTNW